MILGEKMSEVVDLEQICEDHNGEIYADPLHRIMHRPLGLGALIYAKLKRTGVDEVEVWWNHFEGSVTIIAGRYQGVVEERSMPDARTQQLAIVSDFARWVKNEVV